MSTRRWWHIKVAGHPTQYELECFAYMAAKDKVWGRQAEAWINPRALGKLEFTRELLCHPVPIIKHVITLDTKKTIIPRARSMGKSEDIHQATLCANPQKRRM